MSEEIEPFNFLTMTQQYMSALHEMYLSAVEAGFTDAQALAIVREFIRGMHPHS